MKNLKEIKLMMERLESPRLTETELNRKKSLLNEAEDEMGRMVQDVDTNREYLIKQMENKGIVNTEDKKEFLERFLKFQKPIGYDGEKRMEDRIEAAQSLLDEL